MYTTSDRPPGHNQLFNLYVILGIAVLGVLVTSIWDFGGLIQNEQTRYRTGPHGGNYKLLTAVSLIFQGKMTGLLAIAFGAVSLVYLRKTHPSSLSTTDLYMRRNMWLMGFGLINAVIFLWPHDLIFPFALTAILIFPFWRMSPKNLLIAAFVAMLIFTGKNYWDHADSKRDFKKFLAVQTIEKRISKDSATRAKLDSLWVLKTGAVKKPTDTANKKTPKLLNDSLAKAAKNDTLTKKQKSEKSNWENLVKGMKYDSSAQKDENKSMHGSYAKMFSFLLGRTQFQQASWVYKTGIWEISAFMLLGMALFGSGFFDRKWKMSTYLLIAVVCVVAGLLAAWLRLELLNQKLADYQKYVSRIWVDSNQLFLIERMILATGYAATAMILLQTKILRWLWEACSAVGRTALSNYVFQTILCTLFFYGYGMGYFGIFSQLQLYGVVAEIWLIQIVCTIFWLRIYRTGPLEWALQSLVYKHRQPLRKNIIDTNPI